MRIYRALPVVALGLFTAYAQPPDRLTQALEADFSTEWYNDFFFCAKALTYKGQGKDDQALGQLLYRAPNHEARAHYKIGQSRANDAFWDQLAKAGTIPVDCQQDLSDALDHYFEISPDVLGKAAADSDTSKYLALSDLLLGIPSGGLPDTYDFYEQDRGEVANAYRFCFDSLLTAVKNKLGQPE